MANDRLEGKNGPTDSGFLFNVTASDTVDLPYVTRELIIGTGGVIKMTQADGTTDTFTLPAGNFPIRVTRIWATSLTASGIVGVR